MKKNVQHIDEIRFLIIHLILINHWQLNFFLTKTPANRNLVDFWFDLTSPSLALISGYLFFYKTKESLHFGKKLKARVKSLIIPYVFWTLAFFLILFVLKDVYLNIFHSTYWYGPMLSITPSNLAATFVNPPLVNFWYLQNLILIIPFNFLFYYLLKNKWVYILFFCFIISIYSFHLFNIYFQPRFLPYYLLGAFLGYHELYIPRIRLNRIASLVLAVVLFVVGIETSNLEYTNFFVIVLKIVVALFFLSGLYNLIDSNSETALVKYLRNNKPYSFFLFAINMFLFSIVQRALLKMGFEHYLSNGYWVLFFILLSYAIVLLIALSMARLLKTKFSGFYYFITGR